MFEIRLLLICFSNSVSPWLPVMHRLRIKALVFGKSAQQRRGIPRDVRSVSSNFIPLWVCKDLSSLELNSPPLSNRIIVQLYWRNLQSWSSIGISNAFLVPPSTILNESFAPPIDWGVNGSLRSKRKRKFVSSETLHLSQLYFKRLLSSNLTSIATAVGHYYAPSDNATDVYGSLSFHR